MPKLDHEEIPISFDNTTGVLSWAFVSPKLRPAVKEYEVFVATEDIACGTVEAISLSDVATMNCKWVFFCIPKLSTVTTLKC